MNKQLLILAGVVAVIGFLVYIPALRAPLFFDDQHLIIDNEAVHAITLQNVRSWFTENAFAGAGRLSEYYRPLLVASFAAEYALYGPNPLGYHLINILLHALNGILVFALGFLLLRRPWLAFFAALLFVVHPMHSENVAYVAARGDLMSTFFMLTGLLVWAKWIEHTRALALILSSICLVFALLSRENGIVFPFLAMVLYVSVLSRTSFVRSMKEACVRVIPHLLIVAGYFVLRLTTLNFRDFLNFGNFDVTSAYAQHLSVRLYTFLHALLEYVRTFLWPTNVHERFTFPIHESFFNGFVLAGFSFLLLLLGVLMFLYVRHTGTSAEHTSELAPYRMWLFAWGWFFAGLAPATGILPTNVIIQDHRLYLPMIGLLVCGVFFADQGMRHIPARARRTVQYVLVGSLVVYVAFLSWITLERARIWGQPLELFEETLRYEPDAYIAYNQIALEHMFRGEYAEAKRYLEKAIGDGVSFPELYINVGYIYEQETPSNLAGAERSYKKAIELNPKSWYAHRRIAELYMRAGSDQAVPYLKRLSELRPRDANVLYNLALVLHLLGRDEEAYVYARNGQTLARSFPEAERQFAELLARIRPSH